VTQRLVLDASAALHIVLRSEHASRLILPLKSAGLVIAPRLYCSETANGLWKYCSAGILGAEKAVERHEEAMALVDHCGGDESLGSEALMEAVKHNHPVYDMIYLVLARRNACGILTMDQRLRGVAEKLGIPCD